MTLSLLETLAMIILLASASAKHTLEEEGSSITGTGEKGVVIED